MKTLFVAIALVALATAASYACQNPGCLLDEPVTTQEPAGCGTPNRATPELPAKKISCANQGWRHRRPAGHHSETGWHGLHLTGTAPYPNSGC